MHRQFTMFRKVCWRGFGCGGWLLDLFFLLICIVLAVGNCWKNWKYLLERIFLQQWWGPLEIREVLFAVSELSQKYHTETKGLPSDGVGTLWVAHANWIRWLLPSLVFDHFQNYQYFSISIYYDAHLILYFRKNLKCGLTPETRAVALVLSLRKKLGIWWDLFENLCHHVGDEKI